MLSDIRKAGLRQMLRTLEEEPTKALSVKEMRNWAGPEAAAEAERSAEEMMSCNRDMEHQFQLSKDADQYVKKVNALIREMKLAQAAANRGWEKKIHLKSEKLLEFFNEVIHGEERSYFIEHHLDGSNWDDRWHNTGEFFPPLLSKEAMGKLKPFPNPKGQAQMEMIRNLLRAAGDDI